VLSVSFEKADVETRGKFAFFDENIKNFVTRIHNEDLGDAFVVSTCNRTEIYTTSPNYLLVAEEYCKTIGVNLMDFLQFANILTKEEALITFSELQPDWKARLSEILRSSDRLKKPTTVSKKKDKL
jgi:glutamyl-tRNA reductase